MLYLEKNFYVSKIRYKTIWENFVGNQKKNFWGENVM